MNPILAWTNRLPASAMRSSGIDASEGAASNISLYIGWRSTCVGSEYCSRETIP